MSGANASSRSATMFEVQRLTFEAYMNKKLVRVRAMAHLRTGLKNIAHLTRLIPVSFT